MYLQFIKESELKKVIIMLQNEPMLDNTIYEKIDMVNDTKKIW